jgi:hypothetical protein
METDPFLFDRVPKPFLIGFYDGEIYQEFTTARPLLDYIQTREPLTIYAHNGGKFDFHFIVEHIPPYTEYIIINGKVISFPFGQHEFRDSVAILPIALEEYQKTKIDYSWFELSERERHMPEIRAYLKSDCVNLYKLIIQFVRDYGEKLTLALSALNYWRGTTEPENKRGINSSRYFFSRLKPYFYGGRVQAFEKGVFKQRTRIYDINSAYPYAMTQKHPFGTEYRVISGPDPRGFQAHCFYLIEATSNGIMPVREIHKLNYSAERGIFFATGHEILAGLATKTLDIHAVHESIIFNRTIDFKVYVDYFYAIKRSAARNSAPYIFAKLLMNSFYGKLAADPEHYNHYQSIPARKIRVFKTKGWEYGGLITENVALMSRPLERREHHYYNLATAASITGCVRAMLWLAICRLRAKGNIVYYCDTDSIITDGKLNISDNLGGWKLEQENDILAIAERKLYAARQAKPIKSRTGHATTERDTKARKWKIASKGAQLTARQICHIASGGTVNYDSAAPTFRLGKEPSFVSRVLKRR